MADPYAALADGPDVTIARAALAALNADATLGSVLKQPVKVFQNARLVLTAASFTAPAVALVLDAVEETRAGSNRVAELKVALAFAIVTRIDDVGDAFGAPKIADHIRATFEATAGVLKDPADKAVTQGITEWARLPSGTIEDGVVLTPMVCLFKTRIDQETRLFR